MKVLGWVTSAKFWFIHWCQKVGSLGTSGGVPHHKWWVGKPICICHTATSQHVILPKKEDSLWHLWGSKAHNINPLHSDV